MRRAVGILPVNTMSEELTITELTELVEDEPEKRMDSILVWSNYIAIH